MEQATPLNLTDDVKNAVMVHLSRPAEFEAGDKVYMSQVLEIHPDLAEFIHEHIYDEFTSTEHIIMDAFVFEYSKVYTALLGDCKFEVVEYVDRHGKKMNTGDHVAQLMEKVKSVAVKQEDC